MMKIFPLYAHVNRLSIRFLVFFCSRWDHVTKKHVEIQGRVDGNWRKVGSDKTAVAGASDGATDPALHSCVNLSGP